MSDRPVRPLPGLAVSRPDGGSRATAGTIVGIVCWLAILMTPVPARSADLFNLELAPGARLIFPYFDVRPGTQTFLLFTNTGEGGAGVSLNFYDRDCNRRDFRIGLSPHDIDLLDVGAILGSGPAGEFQQGFVDASSSGSDALLGTAIIVDLVQDWSVVYHAAATQRLVGGETPFRRFPTTLFVPALRTPGAAGPQLTLDGLLILVAPNQSVPGGPLPEQPIQASVIVTGKGGILTSHSVAGHQVILPIGELTGGLPPLSLGWIELSNRALDEAGNPIGMVGLLIQNLDGAQGGMAMAIRLPRVWKHPLFP